MKKIYGENANYIVGKETMGLREANHPVFATIIQDANGIYYSRKTALQLLNESCLLKGGSDYRGKIVALKHNLKFYYKTPLIISREEKIYAFPTKSPTHFDCRWIFPEHINEDEFVVIDDAMYVIFRNGQLFPLNCSYHIFKNQLKRAIYAFYTYSKQK